MTSLRLRPVLALAAVPLAIALMALAPPPLGGTAVWVSTHGISMEPGITAGDLVIARPQPSYGDGDVIAYPSRTLAGTVVLHRIIATEPDGFVTQGDNNTKIDPDRPQSSEILGAMWLHIPHGGRVLGVFANPWVILTLLAVLLATAGVLARRPHRRAHGRRRRAGGTDSAFRPAVLDRVRIEHAYAGAAGAVALGLFALTQPAATIQTRQVPVEHSMSWSYSGPADVTGVYAGDRVATGDPVFLSVAPIITVSAGYVAPEVVREPRGSTQFVARLSASNSWHRTFALGSAQEFGGPTAQFRTRLDLRALLARIQTAERRAGTSFGSYRLEVVGQMRVNGLVAGRRVATEHDSSLAFDLSSTQAVPIPADGTRTVTNHVGVPGQTASTVDIARWSVRVSILRWFSIALLGASVLLAIYLRRRPRSQRDEDRIFGDRLVSAGPLLLRPSNVVEVADAAALARIAQKYDEMVLAVTEEQGAAYVVRTGTTTFRYRPVAFGTMGPDTPVRDAVRPSRSPGETAGLHR
jgi:signal peptidase I